MSPCKTRLPITAFHPEQQKKVEINDTLTVNQLMSGQLHRFNLCESDNARSGNTSLPLACVVAQLPL